MKIENLIYAQAMITIISILFTLLIVLMMLLQRSFKKNFVWSDIYSKLTSESNQELDLRGAIKLMKYLSPKELPLISSSIISYVKNNVYNYDRLKEFQENINNNQLRGSKKILVRELFIKYFGIGLHLHSLPRLYARCILAEIEQKIDAEKEKQFILETIGMVSIDDDVFFEATVNELKNRAQDTNSQELKLAIAEEIENIKNREK